MLQKLRSRATDEQGFTLIELLVVILIIGILAAIALPTFLGQRAKAQDAGAKSDARNAVSQMESCYTDAQTYNGCNNANSPLAPSVTPTILTGGTSYSVSAHSTSGGDFIISRSVTGDYTRTCTGSTAGCNNGSW